MPNLYPQRVFDTPSVWDSQLGTFWANYFTDKAVIHGIYSAVNQDINNLARFIDEIILAGKIETTPLTSTVPLGRIELLSKDARIELGAELVYGPDGALHGQPNVSAPYDRVFNYGDRVGMGTWYVVPLTVDYSYIAALAKNATSNGQLWVYGADFFIEDGELWLSEDPFALPGVEDYYVSGKRYSKVVLWGFGCEASATYLYDLYGYPAGASGTSSEWYRTWLKALWSSHTGGPSNLRFRQALSALTGMPVAKDAETVEVVTSQHVVTDKNVYSLGENSAAVVVDQELKAGDPVVDGLSVTNLEQKDDNGANGIREHTITTTEIEAPIVVWSPEKTEFGVKTFLTSASQTFYGTPFGNETLSIVCTSLPAHKTLKLSFDLLLMGDGWSNSAFSVDCEQITALDTTFSNAAGVDQSYPETGSDPKTGAEDFDCSIHNYSLYHFDLTVPHTLPTGLIQLTASGILNSDKWCLYDIGDSPVGNRYLGAFDSRAEIALAYCTSEDAKSTLSVLMGDPVGNAEAIETLTDTIISNFLGTYWVYPYGGWVLRNVEIEAIECTAGGTLTSSTDTKFSTLTGIELGTDFLEAPVSESIFFPNTDVPLVLTEGSTGLPEVTFDLYGEPTDITAFWTYVRGVEVETGVTLAQLLDTRPNPSGVITSEYLPVTINPMRFVLSQFLRYNTVVVTIKSSQVASDAVGLARLYRLRDILSPGKSYILGLEEAYDDGSSSSSSSTP